MIAIILGQSENDQIRKAMYTAHERRRTVQNPVNDDACFFELVTIDGRGVLIAYSVDANNDETAYRRHLSVSLRSKQTVPSSLMAMLTHVFGFENPTLGTMESDPEFVVHALELYNENKEPR